MIPDVTEWSYRKEQQEKERGKERKRRKTDENAKRALLLFIAVSFFRMKFPLAPSPFLNYYVSCNFSYETNSCHLVNPGLDKTNEGVLMVLKCSSRLKRVW